MRIGYHISIAGSLDLAFDRAKEIGCSAMQVFAGNPRGWALNEISDAVARRFVEKGKRYDINPVFIHASYLLNLASPNENVYAKSKAALASLIHSASLLGVKFVVVHLGSDLGKGKSFGKGRVADAINDVWSSKNVMLLMENEAGQRNSVGSQVEDIADIRDMINERRNVGFCFDTCHAFAAGYDIRKEDVLEGISKVIDAGAIKVIHLNDAKYGLGSHLDRHELIGKGHIGVEGFATFFRSKIAKGKPVILETPWGSVGHCKREIELVRRISDGIYREKS